MAVKGLDEYVAASLARVEEADFILSLGVDPVNEAPMLALSMRQARRRNASVVVADPRPVFLPFGFFHFPMISDALEYFGGFLVHEALKEAVGRLSGKSKQFYESLPSGFAPEPELEEAIRDLGHKLAASKKPVIICGTDIPGETAVALTSDLAHLLRECMEEARLFYVLPGPNAFGAALMSPEDDRTSVLEILESDRVKALVLVEQDPFWDFPDRERLEKAINNLEYLLVLDYVPSLSAKKAQDVMPTTTLFERTVMTLVNQEGRVQKIYPVHQGGTPLSQISKGKHPPRTFLDHIPGGEPMAAHELLAEIYTAISGKDKTAFLNDCQREWNTGPEAGHLLPQQPSKGTFSSLPLTAYSKKEGLELLFVEQTFGTEELSSYSRLTATAEKPPCFQMHPDDAARLGLEGGDHITVSSKVGELSMELEVTPSMASGVIIAPRHRQVFWQHFEEGKNLIGDVHIHKKMRS